MSDAQAEILVRAEMNDRLSAALQRINGQLSNTVRSLNGLKATSQSAVGATNAVGAAISRLSRNSSSLNTSLKGNALSQHALSASFRNSRIQADALNSQLGRLQSAGLNTVPIRAYITQLRVMDSMQKQIGNSMRAMNFQQMGSQLNAFSQRMTNAGTRMSMGLTLPLVAFFRMGFSSFRALDKQVIRSTKLMADSFDDSVKNTAGAAKGYTDLQYAVKTLGDGLDKITSKWGVSRELVQGLAGDFAELGISAPESLARLTELTVEFEKLGNIDITQAQSTIQAMFQTISRIRTDKGLDVTSEKSLKQMTEEINGAIAFFNFAENKTTLSLNNIAEAFPEVTAAATSFGLNMQTTAALLVPMIGASFQVGASANSIKVSLQRMVATTKQNKDMLKDLSDTIGKEFAPSLGLGAGGLMDLITNYDLLKAKLSKADQLVFFSKLFGVRQGPRMEVAIAQMNKYDKRLKAVGTQEQKMAKQAEDAINTQLKIRGFTKKEDEIKIGNLQEIANLTSAAQEMDEDGNYKAKALAIQAGQEVALFNLRNANQALQKNGITQYEYSGKVMLDNTKKQERQNKLGKEFNNIQTESGKLLTAQLYGKSLTEENKNDELERVRNSVEVQYGKAREAAKSIARELTSVFGGILEQINPIIERIAKFFRELSDPIKKILGVMLILLALIGPLMRTIGAVGQLGAIFNNVRAGGIKRFKGNVVELNQSLMKTSDIALRIGGNFRKFGQDGKIFTSRKDAKRLEKLAPIIAKQDRGEELTAKEKSKGGKYIKQLAGRKAVLDGTALQSQKNFYGLDQATKDYVRSLDPIYQTNKMVNELLQEQSKKTASIFRKAAQKFLRIRGASNNATGAGIDPATGGVRDAAPYGPAVPTPAPITSAIGGITTLRDILSQILSTLQAIQACVCNAKAAATGRPSPAASGAPTNAPPAGLSGAVVTPVTLGQKPTTATGTPSPTGAAATAVDLSNLSDEELAASKARLEKEAKQLEAEAKETAKILAKAEKEKRKLAEKQYKNALKKKLFSTESVVGALKPQLNVRSGLPANFMNPMAMMNAMKPTMPEIPAGGDILKPAIDKGMHAVAEAVMVSIGKKPVAPAASPIPAAIEAATATAEETVATDVKQKAKRGRGRPKAAGPIPAAIDIAVAEGEKTVAEAIVADTKKTRGRPKGTTKKPAVTPAVSTAQRDYAAVDGFGRAVSGPNKATVDLEAAGASIKKLLNLEGTAKSAILTKDSLIKLFTILGQDVPVKLRQLDSLVNKEGEAIKVNLSTLGKIAGAIKTGVAGKALAPDAKVGAAFTGTSAKTSPFYAKNFNEAVSSSVGNIKYKPVTAIKPEDIAVAKESVAQVTEFEKERQILKDKIKILADQARVIKGKIDDLVAQESRAAKVGNLSLARVLQIKILSEKRKMSDVQRAISELKRTTDLINTELQSVRQSANLAFNNAQQQIASSGGVPFAGAKGKGMPFGSTTARARAKRTGERYTGLVYGGRDSKGDPTEELRERREVTRPSYSRNDPEEKDRQARRVALRPKRKAGIELLRQAVTQQPDYIEREKRRVAQAARDAEFAAKQEADRLAKQQEAALKKLGVKPEKVEPVQSSPIKRGFMSKEQFLAGQAENLQSLNEQIKAANDSARSAKRAVKNLETQIQEVTESKKRIPGGKKNAIDELTTRLEDAKKKAEQAKAAAKAAKDDIARINAYDPAKGGLPPKPVAPDISAAVRPKSLSAGVPTGATTLGNINSQLSATLQIPTAVLDQFYQTLKIQGKGLAEVASNAGLQATDDLALLKQELLKIGLTIEQALAKPAETLKQLQAVKFQDSGEVQALFQRLVMFARDVANKGVEKAFQDTIARFQNLKPGAAVKPASAKPASAPANKAAYGFGLESADQKILAEQIKSQIIAQNKAAIDFMKFETKTLEYIGRAFAIEGRGKGKKEVVVANLIKKLKEMGIAVEKAIVTEAIAPINAAKDAVTTTAATAAGASVGKPKAPVTAQPGNVIGNLGATQIQNFMSIANSVSEDSATFATQVNRLAQKAGLEGQETSVIIQKILSAFEVYLKNNGLTEAQLRQADALLREIATGTARPFSVAASKVYESARGSKEEPKASGLRGKAVGATADETAKVVEAEKNLTVAVEKTIADAAKAVTISANAAANPRLAAIASGVKLSPLASPTTGVAGPKATDATPAVAVRTPYSMPYINEINSQAINTKAVADSIAENIRLASSGTAKKVQSMLSGIQELVRSVHGAQIAKDFAFITGGNITDALKYLDRIIQEKLVKEAEKVKAVADTVKVAPVAPAPPVAPKPPVATAPVYPAPPSKPMLMLNAAKESPRRAAAQAKAAAAAVGTVGTTPIEMPRARVNLREMIAERLAIKATMEAETAAMAERIRSNVALSQAIRERSRAMDVANRSDRVQKLIDATPIPPRPSAGRNRIPLTREEFTGQTIAKTANVMFNPIKQVKVIGSALGSIGGALESVAKRVSPKRFGDQNVYKARDYMGEARRTTFGRIADRNLQVTSRQSRIAEKDARVIAKETRATDRPNRNIARLTQSQLPSQFRQAINPSIDTLKAIAKTYGPPIKSAMNFAKKKSIEGLKIAGQVTRELTLLPVRVPIVFTTGLIEAHKFAMKGVRAGIAKLDSIAFFNTTYTGAAIITLAITLEKGLTKLGSAMTMGGQALLTSGQIAAKFVQTAFTNPKQALAMASTGLTNSKDLLFKAGAGLVAAASSIKVGAIKLAQSAGSAAVAGAKMAGGAIGKAAMAPVRGVKTMFVGGSTFVPQGTDAAGNAIATKKGGLFRRSVTQTTDATTGMMTEQRGKGMFGRMKGGLGKGVMGGIRGLGTAAGSMSSMMLYQLGPAGMALQGPLNKVIGLLTKTKGAFFGVTIPILLVVGAIFLLKKTFSAYGDKTTGVAENFKKAFAAVMVVVNMLKTAFFDFFASLFGGAESSGEATGNIATVVTKVAEATRKFAVAFQAFFTKYILPAIYTMLSGFSMIIRAIFSFVSNLVKFVMAIVSFFRGGGDKAKEAMVSAMKGMLKAIVNALKGLLKMVLPMLSLLIKAVTKVVELIVQLFEWLVIGVINLIRYMVKGVINLVFTIVKAYVFIIDKIIELFVLLETTAIKIATEMVIAVIKIFFGIVKGTVAVVKGIISIWAKLPAGVGKGIGMIGSLIAGLMRGIGDKLAGLWGIGGKLKDALYSVADGFEKASNAVEGVGGAATAKLESGIDAIFTPLENGISGLQNKAVGLVRGISGALIKGVSSLNGVGDAVMNVVQGIQNKLLGSVDIAADTANAFIGGFSDAIAGAGNGIVDWLAGLVDGNDIKEKIGDSLKDAVKNVAKDPSAANEAGRAIADAIGEGIKSLKDNFYDKVISNLSDSLGKLKDQITKALEKQKDQSLKFFDDQIAAIDALAAADAELTAEKQKQEDERLRIAERALQRDSYLKNRALAIYEGRIDDARTLGLEEAKNQQEFNKETEKNAKDAQAAAKAKNVEAAKKVIENQKQVASDQFDKDLEDFQTFIENIGKNGTLTAAELTTQFNELKARADLTSSGMQAAFQGYYNALPTLIANNTAPTVGFFTSSMDALIAGAAAKYGLDTGTTDPATMLGITNGMMSNLGTVYTTGFTTVVAPAYNDGQELLAGIAREFADPSASNPKSAAGIYASAIANATAAVRAEFMKMKTDASSAFAEVVAAINDELKGLAITKAIADAAEELKNTGGGTAPSGGSATSPATGVTGPTAPTGFGPLGLTQTAFEALAGKDRLFKLNDSNDYIKSAKAALAFYGYTGFDVNSTKMGTGTVAALKSFQKKYPVGGNNDGNLGPSTAKALGLFSGVGVQKKFMGGMIKRAVGGVVPGYSTEGVPAILHGGEYVISSKAVQNLGLGLLTQLNGLKHGVPSFNVPKPQMPSASGLNMSVTSHSQSETTQNYNFYVDNFIGEDQWFESMMKDYNIKVVPNNQKAAGLESRVVRTYNGINRGM
jgi:phage-related protein